MANQILKDIRQKIKNGNVITRLIIVNAAVFLLISLFRILLLFLGSSNGFTLFVNEFIANLTLSLSFKGLLYKPWTLITYMFVHVELMHLFWNMITLFWFGQILMNFTDSKKIIPLYILGGLMGGIITVVLINTIPMFSVYIGLPLLGASAGVTAIIIAAATLVPNFQMNLMFVGPVKLIYVALFVLFIDVLSVASYSNVGGNLAHLGGALMGYVFILQLKKGKDLSKGMNRFFNWVLALFNSKPKSKLHVVHKRPISDEEYNFNRKATQQQIDAILDKISKSGYDSLTNSEKDILFNASKK